MGALTYLVDTHALLWWLFDDARLSRRVRAALRNPDNRVLVSSASAWEIATKHRLGKLDSAAPLVREFSSWIAKAGFGELAIRCEQRFKLGRGTRCIAILRPRPCGAEPNRARDAHHA